MIDTHTHVISSDLARYPLHPSKIARAHDPDWFRERALSADTLVERASEAGVDRIVFVQAMGAYGFDNDYCADAARAHRDHATGVCIVDPEGDDAPATLAFWVHERGMRGVRLFAIGWEPGRMESPPVLRVAEAAGGLGIPVVATILSHQIPELDGLAGRFPDLPIALDHCGFPDLEAGPPYSKAGALLSLASRQSVHLKVSGLVLGQIEQSGGRPADFVHRLAAEFGARRLMWGSDYPQTHDRSYAALVALCRDAAADLSDADREWYLGRTAASLWPELSRDPSSGRADPHGAPSKGAR